MTEIIAVVNQKGGVGKTTTAINLAACVAERRRRVLLIDFDPQANTTSGVGIDKVRGVSLYRPLLGEVAMDEMIRETRIPRLDLIPGELDLAGAQVELARRDAPLFRLRELLAEFLPRHDYDFVFIDCSPSLGILTMNVLSAAERLILPIQCEYYALEGLSAMAGLVTQLQNNGVNPELLIEGIVMTMYDGRTNLAQQVVQEVVTHFNDIVFETLIPRTVRLAEAPSFGQPIIRYAPNCTGAVAYRMLAKEFLERNDRTRAPLEGQGLPGVVYQAPPQSIPNPFAQPAPAPSGTVEPTPEPL